MKSTFCDGINRRDFLKVGAMTGIGLSLSNYLSMAGAGEVADARGKAGIFIRLAGGPTHLDTFDLKPNAPAEFRGEFNPIKTNVAGMEICEHLPKLAQVADKFAILRGVSHTLGAHELGSRYMNTGNKPIPSLTFPCYGSVVAKEKGAAPDMPPFVAIPSFGNESAGYLGVEYGPLEIGSSPQKGQPVRIRGLTLNGVTLEEIDRRQNLLQRYDTAFGSMSQEDRVLAGMDQFGQKAYAMMRSNKAREAFDLSRESATITSMFGEDPFHQSCLLAARLVESGVKFVTISLGGWDTHSDNFNSLKTKLLPALDGGLAGLFRARRQGPAFIHRRFRHRRIRPYPQDQPASRPRPLSPRDVLPARRRRNQGRPGRRRVRCQSRRTQGQGHHPRRRGGNVLQGAGH
jgi:hypothetical protein